MQRLTPGSSSAMDVSHDAETPLDGGLSPRASPHGKGPVGYQGWAARRLVVACHRIFLAELDDSVQDCTDLVPVSLEYRGVIFLCLSNINADVGAPASPATSQADLEDEDVFHDGLTDFYHVWTLAEAFLLDSAPLPAAPLLRWLKMYSQSGEDEAARWELDEAERTAQAADAEGRSADITPAYWNALRSLVVSVNPRRAAEMLRCHPEGRDSAGEIGAVARQLEKMPLLLPERLEEGQGQVDGDHGGEAQQLDRVGFFETWTRWRKGCKAAAASFGFVSGGSGGGGSVGEEKHRLQWLWGALCGERGCLEEATESWSGLFAAVLAFERPDVRKEEVASVLRECAKTHPQHQHEDFLLKVIRDASTGAVEAILRFATDHGDTLALSACAAHLVDLLFRAELPSVTNAQRSWFFRRLADRLKASPFGGWELAAAYVGAGQADAAGGGDGIQLLRDLTRAVVPGSERAAHELVEWCRVNGLGERAVAAVCRARGVAWIGKTGFSPAAMGTADEGALGEGKGARVSGACGKAAYWLAKGGGGVQLERLCAELSERLMVEVSVGPGAARNVEAQQAVLNEAEGVLAAIPQDFAGSELSFLERYKEIAELLLAETEERSLSMEDSPGPHARRAGALAVDMLAPPSDSDISPPPQPPPSRSWAHLLRLALPTLREIGGGGGGGGRGGAADAPITARQVHILMGNLQALVASEHRVGTEGGVRPSTLSSAPAPYGFRGGKEEVLELRRALAGCLGATMMVQNALDAGSAGRMDSRGGSTWGSERLPAEALIAPRVAVRL